MIRKISATAILLASVFTLSLPPSAAQVSNNDAALKKGVVQTTIALPDLVIREARFPAGLSAARVLVANVGRSKAKACYLAFMLETGQPGPAATKQRVWTVAVPPLAAGSSAWVSVNVSPLNSSDGDYWKARVDRSNSVKESDESNNEYKVPKP